MSKDTSALQVVLALADVVRMAWWGRSFEKRKVTTRHNQAIGMLHEKRPEKCTHE